MCISERHWEPELTSYTHYVHVARIDGFCELAHLVAEHVDGLKDATWKREQECVTFNEFHTAITGTQLDEPKI